MSTITEPAAIAAHRVLGDEQRRAPPGHLRGGDHHVVPGDMAGELGLLRVALLGGELAGVPALARRVDRRGQLDERRARATRPRPWSRAARRTR